MPVMTAHWRSVCIFLVLCTLLTASTCARAASAPPPTQPQHASSAASVPALAGSPAGAGNHRLRFQRITPENGLSSGVVSSIVQDRSGFMWFGTDNGLNRFDGRRVTVYRHDPQDPTSLGGDQVATVYEDRSGVLWVGLGEAGLDRMDRDTGQFRHVLPEYLRASTVADIQEDQAGTLWVATSGFGVLRLDPAGGEIARYYPRRADPDSLSNAYVQSLSVDRQGQVWIAMDGPFLDRLRPGDGTDHPRHTSSTRRRHTVARRAWRQAR